VKEFKGNVLLSFRPKAQGHSRGSVVVDVDLTIFIQMKLADGSDHQSNLKVRRVAVMRRADGELWVAWPRDKYEQNGQTKYYNLVTDAAGRQPYDLNQWILAEYAVWAKTAPQPPAPRDPAPMQTADDMEADATALFR